MNKLTLLFCSSCSFVSTCLYLKEILCCLDRSLFKLFDTFFIDYFFKILRDTHINSLNIFHISSHWKKKKCFIPFFPRVPCEYCCHTHFCVLGYDYPILPQRLETGRINGLLTPLKLSNEHIVSCLLKQKLQRHPLWFWWSCLLRMWVCLCCTKLITFKL